MQLEAEPEASAARDQHGDGAGSRVLRVRQVDVTADGSLDVLMDESSSLSAEIAEQAQKVTDRAH
jgi:hypothetical protein